jgi:hypothetical protein
MLIWLTHRDSLPSIPALEAGSIDLVVELLHSAVESPNFSRRACVVLGAAVRGYQEIIIINHKCVCVFGFGFGLGH